MEAYLCALVNWEQNDWARLLLMVEFVYNNSKNATTSHMLFELNCDYHLQILYKEEVDPYSQSMLVDKQLAELKELIIICQKNLYYA